MNLAAIDLDLLVVFDALIETRNVTRAGQRIGLAQPSMSSALARLRALLDDGRRAVRRHLFDEHFVCIRDAGETAPLTAADYVDRPHALFSAIGGDGLPGAVDVVLSGLGLSRRIALTAPHVGPFPLPSPAPIWSRPCQGASPGALPPPLPSRSWTCPMTSRVLPSTCSTPGLFPPAQASKRSIEGRRPSCRRRSSRRRGRQQELPNFEAEVGNRLPHAVAAAQGLFAFQALQRSLDPADRLQPLSCLEFTETRIVCRC